MTTQPTVTYPPKAPDSQPNPRLFASEGQRFLVGDTLFLRGLEEEDASRSTGWRDSVYPINPERAAEIIKESVEKRTPGANQLVACRRSDGVPVGSLTTHMWPGTSPEIDLSLYADLALPDRERIKAEMLRLFVAWGFGERDYAQIYVELDDDQPLLRDAAEELGMRRSAMWRQQIWREGAWRDKVAYEGYHPVWLERLGDPGTGIDFAVAADDPSRWRPRQHPTFGTLDGDPPANTVRVGPRVYLRPMDLEDADVMVLAQRGEPDTFWDEGRSPGSSLSFRHHIRQMAKDEPQEWIQFAICDRQTGEIVGANGVDGADLLNRTAETVTVIHNPAYRGKGYGSEAKHLLLDYLFNTLGLHSVHSWVWGPNTRSQAALRKQGYRDAGRTFWAGTQHGQYTHACLFDFLADEWHEMTARSDAAQTAAVP